MTNEPVEGNLFNPFMVWTDWGMRAAEAAVASTQNMTEGADRLTRAAAAAEVQDAGWGASAPDGAWAPAGLSSMVEMQRMVWELTTRSWTQWMTMTGNLMSAGAGVGLARSIAHQRNPLQVVHDSVEHALASPESRPRAPRKAAARRRISRKR